MNGQEKVTAIQIILVAAGVVMPVSIYFIGLFIRSLQKSICKLDTMMEKNKEQTDRLMTKLFAGYDRITYIEGELNRLRNYCEERHKK